MDYEITHLSDKLVLIKWHQSPSSPEVETQFLVDLRRVFDEADQPIYLISDLRGGRIENVDTLRQLGECVQHPNCGGSTAFTGDVYTSLFVRVFTRFAGKRRPSDEVWGNPNDALAYLESLELGITEGIDWETIIND